eukprot:234367_1
MDYTPPNATPILKIFMQEEEQKLLLAVAAKQSKLPNSVYLEWGMGGSTENVAPLFPSAYSVENDPSYCEKMKKRPLQQRLAKQTGHHFICRNGGPVGQWAIPKNKRTYDSRSYVEVMDGLDVSRFDMVLIDGRFRVACALRALKYVDEKSFVVIHDFFDRPHYHVVLKFYEVVQKSKTLAVLKKRSDFDHVDEKLYEEYIQDFR